MVSCSVIVVSHNAMPYSEILYSTYKRYTRTNNIKLVWVDNNSTDGTVEWLEDLPIDHLMLLDENVGAAYARDKAIQEIDTDAVCFLDNDIAITQIGWINRLLRVLYSDDIIGTVTPAFNLILDDSHWSSFTEHIGAVWSRTNIYTKDMGRSAFTHDEDVQPYINKYLTILKKHPFRGKLCLEGGGTTLRRSTYLESGGYEQAFTMKHEGWLLGKNISALKLQTWVVPSVFLFHYGHATRNTSVLPDFHQKIKISEEAKKRWLEGRIQKRLKPKGVIHTHELEGS